MAHTHTLCCRLWRLHQCARTAQVTQLKIRYNPFAKAFQDARDGRPAETGGLANAYQPPQTVLPMVNAYNSSPPSLPPLQVNCGQEDVANNNNYVVPTVATETALMPARPYMERTRSRRCHPYHHNHNVHQANSNDRVVYRELNYSKCLPSVSLVWTGRLCKLSWQPSTRTAHSTTTRITILLRGVPPSRHLPPCHRATTNMTGPMQMLIQVSNLRLDTRF